MSEDIMVVAFDGMDYELIKEFGLENIKQQEFGKIDNYTKMSSIKTAELFASFITGKNWEKHSIKGISPHQYTLRHKMLAFVTPEFFQNNIRGFFRLNKALKALLGLDVMFYDEEDIKEPTLFDKIDNSKAEFVPPYSNSKFRALGAEGEAFRRGYGVEEVQNLWRTREFRHVKETIFKGVNSFYDFSMFHIHFIDVYQHTIDTGGEIDTSELESLYEEMDEFAGRILKEYRSDYDKIIFMSDHGLPDVGGEGHNRNAFYSCNHELFGDKTPHITDFHDKILNLVEDQEGENL